jgi:CRISPR/Cas system CSM-associated protein Csm3 (group 7 of RAMP superfamily)
MGWSSKIFFGDLIAESEGTACVRAAHQFTPHPDAEKYLDTAGYHAYKFYKTKIDEVTIPKNDILRAVPPKTVFTGEITYRNLDKKELGLLLFGLGQSKSISLKLGGYRNEGFGTVNITLASDQISDPLSLTKEYIDSVDKTLVFGIEQLEDDMPYKA